MEASHHCLRAGFYLCVWLCSNIIGRFCRHSSQQYNTTTPSTSADKKCYPHVMALRCSVALPFKVFSIANEYMRTLNGKQWTEQWTIVSKSVEADLFRASFRLIWATAPRTERCFCGGKKSPQHTNCRYNARVLRGACVCDDLINDREVFPSSSMMMVLSLRRALRFFLSSLAHFMSVGLLDGHLDRGHSLCGSFYLLLMLKSNQSPTPHQAHPSCFSSGPLLMLSCIRLYSNRIPHHLCRYQISFSNRDGHRAAAAAVRAYTIRCDAMGDMKWLDRLQTMREQCLSFIRI